MKPFVGANVLYRYQLDVPLIDGAHVLGIVDVAATCVGVNLDGSIDLVIFPAMPDPRVFHRVTAVRGWSHYGSDPHNPVVGTWHWQSALIETGTFGRGFIAEIMKSPAEWSSTLSMFANLQSFREQYQQAREVAIARDWPELPKETQ